MSNAPLGAAYFPSGVPLSEIQFTLHIPDDLLAWLDEYADTKRSNRTATIVAIIWLTKQIAFI